MRLILRVQKQTQLKRWRDTKPNTYIENKAGRKEFMMTWPFEAFL